MIKTDYQTNPFSQRKSIISPLAKYLGGKIFSLLLMVTMSVLLVILIGNFGGHIDEMVEGEISQAVGLRYRFMYLDLSPADRAELINQAVEEAYNAAGLNEPFVNRTLRWLWMAIRLDLGHPIEGSPFFPPQNSEITIRQMLAQSFPPTLALFGTVNFVVFFSSLGIGLISSQQYGSSFDRFQPKSQRNVLCSLQLGAFRARL